MGKYKDVDIDDKTFGLKIGWGEPPVEKQDDTPCPSFGATHAREREGGHTSRMRNPL